MPLHLDLWVLFPKDSFPAEETLSRRAHTAGVGWGCSLAVFQRQACLWREGKSCGGADTHGKLWACELFALLAAVFQG